MKLRYFYDKDGLTGFRLCDTITSTDYSYVKDAQNNIIAIMNSDNIVQAKYEYDSMGRVFVMEPGGSEVSSWEFIGTINPFRWKSQYYDEETGFYYINGRYYEIETGQFISVDSVTNLKPYDINGLNLYAYHDESILYNQLSPLIKGLKNIDLSKRITNDLLLSKSNWLNLFGYELRKSDGWNKSSDIYIGYFGRIGFSSYITETKGKSGVFYAFAGSTSNIMNLFGTTYYAGIGMNLFNKIGVELQLEALGVGAQISIGTFSVGLNINLIGETSFTFGRNTDFGNGKTGTRGFTVGVNTGFLVAAVLWIYKLVTTGDTSPLPGWIPA